MGCTQPCRITRLRWLRGTVYTRIEELEARGSRLTNTIVELLLGLLDNGKELRTKRAQIEICRSFRALIHLLPLEVLSRIFQLTLPKRRKNLWTHSPQLLRVCKALLKVSPLYGMSSRNLERRIDRMIRSTWERGNVLRKRGKLAQIFFSYVIYIKGVTAYGTPRLRKLV